MSESSIRETKDETVSDEAGAVTLIRVVPPRDSVPMGLDVWAVFFCYVKKLFEQNMKRISWNLKWDGNMTGLKHNKIYKYIFK